jgi:hypothetical protein
MCSLNIALRNYLAGEVIGIVLRNCKYIFGQFNHTKNRGACVDDIIWLVDQANQLIFCSRIATDLHGEERYVGGVLAKHIGNILS